MKKLKNITKKAGLVVLALLVISSMSSPEKEVHKIIKILKSGKTQKIEKYYLAKAEFIDLVNHMDPKPSQEQIDGLLDSYETSKETYLKTFENIEIDDWNTCEINRIEYDYKIGKPGQDEEIEWPKSKDYQPVYKNTEMIKVRFTVILKDKKNKYTMRMEMMNYKGKWKLSHMLRPVYIQKNQQN